eukprot:c47327_g1_i1.p1 GENE.c47327_g1_i1~~c47327_g1_i1.p1  ORF type:complete len:319 (+),score=53.28 c47327_g1_i1:108-959(+)
MDDARSRAVPPTAHPGVTIKDVWADNLEEAFAEIRDLIELFPYVAMDTEFPGVVARPIGNFKSNNDFQYQNLRCNVDLLRIIQIGLTLADERGHIPSGVPTWQFNFKFSLGTDMYAQDSIDLLVRSGIQFQAHEERGIDVDDFGELLIASGLVLVPGVSWVSFASSYDFAYLLKILTCAPLPADEDAFFEVLYLYFPAILDIKHILKAINGNRGGLQDIADELAVVRIGPQHQAGSDSLLTSMTFFRVREAFFATTWNGGRDFTGHLHNLSPSFAIERRPAPM